MKLMLMLQRSSWSGSGSGLFQLMGPKVDVPVYDLSLIRGLWEVRVKKHRQKQKKEQERVERSALARSGSLRRCSSSRDLMVALLTRSKPSTSSDSRFY